MSVFNGLKKAQGLGSGHNGTNHHITQCVVAMMLIPLVLYFFYAVIKLVSLNSYTEVLAWFSNPFNMGLSIAFMGVGFFQAAIGLQVVIEDYVHQKTLKLIAIIAIRSISLVGALVSIAAILKLGI